MITALVGKLSAACALLLAALPTALAQTLSSDWVIISGVAEVEQTAARVLQRELVARHHVRVEIANAPAAGAIYIGTPATLEAVAIEHAKAPFKLDAAEPESYHAVCRDGSLFIVGGSPKGALNGVFRFLEKNTLLAGGLDQAESPAFHLRVGGYLFNQHPPETWSEDDQAEYYASRYMNTVWGEKNPPPLAYEARKKYGLGVMIEVRFPPEKGPWMDEPAHASAVFVNPKANPYQRRAISPFDPLGRETYLAHFRRTLEEYPDTKVLYGAFADYNTIPDENYSNVKTGAGYGRSRADGIREILGLMKEAVGDRDIVVAVWMWHAFYGDAASEKKFMREMAEKGIGVIYNEAGNGDNWLTVRDNFIEAALETGADGRSIYGDNYMPIVSAGGGCESTGAAVALPLPAIAGYKLSRLAEAGAKNFILWWGGVEGWTYNVNMEVIAQMIWNPRAFDHRSPRPFDEPLLRGIAARDFGPLAADVVEFWRQFDRAVVWNGRAYEKTDGGANTGMFVRDWFQRLGVFIRPYTEYGAAFKYPLVPSALARRNEVKSGKLWLFKPEAQENYRTVIADIGVALEKLRALEKTGRAPADASWRLGEMRRWADLFRHLLVSQLNFYRACGAMVEHAGDEAALRQAMEPATRDEIANAQSLIALLREFNPWASASLGTTAVRFQKEPSRDAEIKLIEGKIDAMRVWLGTDDLPHPGAL